MSKKEKAKKDIEIAFDFARYLIEHPEELAKIPDGSEISFLEKSADVPSKKKASAKELRVDVKRDFEIKKKVA
jgi:hypothetical protein